MNRSLFRHATRALAAGLALLPLAVTAGQAPSGGAAGSATAPPAMDAGWPRTFATTSGDTLTVYQPQLDSWDDNRLAAHMAVSSLVAGASVEVYGVATFTARTEVDKPNRQVFLEELTFNTVTFPSAPDRAARFKAELQSVVPARSRAIALDRLETALALSGGARKANALPLENTPPAILFSTVPAVLVSIDGEPAFRPVKGTDKTVKISRVINTSPLIVKDEKAGTLYLHLFDGWVNAKALAGPWSVTTSASKPMVNALNALLRSLVDSGEADPLEGAPSDPYATTSPPSLLTPPVPVVLVATTPTELIVTEGAPVWAPVDGTTLSYIKNTSGRVLRDDTGGQTYILLAGRWFRADSLSGPWQFVAGRDLPKSFAQIPDSSAMENVKASVPGSTQAAEAVIANTIPQTATLSRTATKSPSISIDGEPQLAPIAGTSLQYVTNASRPIIELDADSWYACVHGVWFTAAAAQGPWTIASLVPASIYTIPPGSPLHYVTYVRVYGATKDSVFVGFTPGYSGAVIAADNTVVYGTGYAYQPWIGDNWYAAPFTYGYGANIAWTPWYGWRYGAGYGYAWGWGGYGVGAYRGVGRWGMGNWGLATANVYDQWGPRAGAFRTAEGYNMVTGDRWYDRASVSYNSRTGIAAAGQRAEIGNAFTGVYASGTRGYAYDTRTGQVASYGAARGPNGAYARVGDDVFADHNGNIYRHTADGWQQGARGGWNTMNDANRMNELDRQRYSRDWGEQRYGGFQDAGGARRATWSGASRGGRRR